MKVMFAHTMITFQNMLQCTEQKLCPAIVSNTEISPAKKDKIPLRGMKRHTQSHFLNFCELRKYSLYQMLEIFA